jgi:acyl-CoA reductase-like NAD-dependent aldehyde dehydrogenase
VYSKIESQTKKLRKSAQSTIRRFKSGGDNPFSVLLGTARHVRNDMTIAREEIFGPVLSIIPF